MTDLEKRKESLIANVIAFGAGATTYLIVRLLLDKTNRKRSTERPITIRGGSYASMKLTTDCTDGLIFEFTGYKKKLNGNAKHKFENPEVNRVEILNNRVTEYFDIEEHKCWFLRYSAGLDDYLELRPYKKDKGLLIQLSGQTYGHNNWEELQLEEKFGLCHSPSRVEIVTPSRREIYAKNPGIDETEMKNDFKVTVVWEA